MEVNDFAVDANNTLFTIEGGGPILWDKTHNKRALLACGNKLKVTKNFVFVDCGNIVDIYTKGNLTLLTRVEVWYGWQVLELDRQV